MGGGNGAKSAQSRERNAAKAGKGPSSQLKSNAAAQSLQCFICKQTFQGTSKQAQLTLHTDSKHPKNKFEDCFPGVRELLLVQAGDLQRFRPDPNLADWYKARRAGGLGLD